MVWFYRCVGQVALEQEQLLVAERCCAALGDVARARYLRKVCVCVCVRVGMW